MVYQPNCKPDLQAQTQYNCCAAKEEEESMRAGKQLVLLLVLVTMQAEADARDDEAACEKVKQQIRLIQAKMRNGYSAAQGIRYEERLRELKKKRYRLCR